MNWLDFLCAEYDTNRYKISDKTDIAQTTLSNIINRKTTIESINFLTAKKLADYFEISSVKLFEVASTIVVNDKETLE